MKPIKRGKGRPKLEPTKVLSFRVKATKAVNLKVLIKKLIKDEENEDNKDKVNGCSLNERFSTCKIYQSNNYGCFNCKNNTDIFKS